MKSVLLSVRPEWVAKILNGEKTLEIRKTIPKCDLPIDVYIYCTKEKNKNLYMSMFHGNYQVAKNIDHKHHILNGKVVAKFTLNKVERLYEYQVDGYGSDYEIASDTLKQEELLKECCLTYEQLSDYLGDINNGYAWHIDNLVPFDEPKEVGEFYTTNLDKQLPELFDNSIQLPNGTWVKPLTRAPQSFMFIEV